MIFSFCLLATIVGSLLLDTLVRPRPKRAWTGQRSLPGRALLLAATTTLFGLFFALSGSAPLAAALAVALLAAFMLASNAKHAVLGEPLLFSDLALVGGMMRHPGFYLTALTVRQKAGAVVGIVGLVVALAWLFMPRAGPHLVGAALGVAAGGVLVAMLRGWTVAGLAPEPDADADVARHGLVATMLLYWWRWRDTPDPPACPTPAATLPDTTPELVIVVQCESFADPVALTGNPSLALAGLARARERASLWGDLAVSGFGAYTMRTEYGVLFGRDEDALGFRRFDPFLTAAREASYALPRRLGAAGYTGVFAHPHDLRFYRRDRLMPEIGFSRVIGAEGFPPTPPGERYLDDPTFGTALAALAAAAAGPTFLYAVTMENHGPWVAGHPAGSPGGLEAYLGHLRGSDAMLSGLIDHLDAGGRRALLVFFGDHRPSIPGAVEPGPVRHTPYAMLHFPREEEVSGRRADLSPDELHHAILHATLRRGAICRKSASAPTDVEDKQS